MRKLIMIISGIFLLILTSCGQEFQEADTGIIYNRIRYAFPSTYSDFIYHNEDYLAEKINALDLAINALEMDLLNRIQIMSERIDEMNQEFYGIAESVRWTPLGYFELTFYCDCVVCCGIWSAHHPIRQSTGFVQRTASGTIPQVGRTIAVDTSIIPFGTEVRIHGHIYVAEDTGSAIVGNIIDIYVHNHVYAMQRGRERGVMVYTRRG